MRAKWSAAVRKYWKISEQMMVKYSDLVICDSVNIEKYIHECYDGKGIGGENPKTTFIAYGADLTPSKLADNDERLMNWYKEKGLAKKYVYRHPGEGTDEYINRRSEAESMAVARKLGLDDTFIYIEPTEGWKLSHYIENAKTLDYHNEAQVAVALEMLHRLHTSGERTSQVFDIYKEIQKFLGVLDRTRKSKFEDMKDMRETIQTLHELVEEDKVSICLCHCDSYNPNFLIDQAEKMYLIDWEYSGMSDPGCDIGTFVACSDYTVEEADKVISKYLKEKDTPDMHRHFVAYIAIAAFYWFVWALYQESVGKNVGEYLYIWYRYTKSYSKRALDLYKGAEK